MKPPDILNSKIKKIRIELPHYSFSHSSSGDSPHVFIGRERTREKLKKIVEDSPNEPGVYLVAGNRGVGKTSYVNEVKKETSLMPNTKFTENFRYAFLLFLAIIGVDIVTQFCLEIFDINKPYPVIFQIALLLISFLSFILLCYTNDFRRKINKKNTVSKILDGIKSAFTELGYLINPYNPYEKLHYALKTIFIVCSTRIISEIINYIFNKDFSAIIIVYIYLLIVFICMYIRFFKRKWQKDKNSGLTKIFQIFFYESILYPINNYIKNHNRLYLNINFGHKLKDEKDILRLITRTLGTEYNKYRRLIRRMLPWRIMAFCFLFIFAYLFSPIIEEQQFYKKIIKDNKLYKSSSQILLQCPTLEKDKKRLEGVFTKRHVVILNKPISISKVIGNNTNNPTKIFGKLTKQEFEVDKKIGKVGKFILVIDQVIYEITKIIKKAPYYFWKGEKNANKKFIPPINYLFWLLFFIMYLFSKLIFYFAWKTHFFVTHGIIIKQLKRLNGDITHSTELEKSININSVKTNPIIGIKTRKSREVADAREIEKELQDILSDINRIPVIMCRPNIVIVFDELDKVEPEDESFEREIPQTKASLFSIDATRNRQTEILRILSNMKYFLSTARAKFIFIAGREMYDIHLADVSERNNYIGSIFNASILVPSFLTDHHTGRETLPQESSIASLPEEFVCRRLFPNYYNVNVYNLKNYRIYLKKVIFKKIKNKTQKNEMIEKVIAVLQQFIIYLAHVSKGAPKKMIQLFESFIDIFYERDNEENTLLVQNFHGSRHFLSFNYYKQYTIGIIAYLITPVFYRLAESNIKEHSDRLLVSSLRFIDFLFKFHKHSFSWKILDISPEMLEVNRAPELKSVVVDLINYLTQIHINKSNFSLSEYKFDSLIANEIFAMAKTDEVFSALFSFSLDEMLPLKKHYQDLLEKTQKEYKTKKKSSVFKFIDAISSLQVVLGDLCYYNDELEEAEVYYKSVVQAFYKLRNKNEEIPLEQFYVYVRNMLRLGMIYERRKQYDFAYMNYGELCKQIIQERDINNIRIPFSRSSHSRKILSNTTDRLFKKTAFEGLKMLYLPFIAKLQILELSHMGGITCNHLKQLDEEFNSLTYNIDAKEAKLMEAEFYSRVADILYYKNSDLKCRKGKNRKDKDIYCNNNNDAKNSPENTSCTVCYYYHKALSILLNLEKYGNKDENTVIKLLISSFEQLHDKNIQINGNNNMKFCTILARILSDWGNVFFSCDSRCEKENNDKCYICDGEEYNTISSKNFDIILKNCIKYIESEEKNAMFFSSEIKQLKTKKDIAFTMYSISLHAYRKANLYKRSAYQIFKMLCLFKHYDIYKSIDYIERLSKIAIHYLWHANENLNILELNKRKKDFEKITIGNKDKIPLENLLVDSEITRIWITVEKLKLLSVNTPEELKKFYNMRITSPYKINYSIEERIYRLWLKSKVNYNMYQQLIEEIGIKKGPQEKEYVLEDNNFKDIFNNNECKEKIKIIFGKQYNIIQIFENLIAETIYCLIDIAQLSETMGETYVFTNSFLASIHARLSFWIRLYESYEIYKEKINFYNEYGCKSHIKDYFKKYLDEEWREQLSGYRENQIALSYYYKCLEMHNEGRAYHNRIDTMCYLTDNYNDRSDHYNIAEERHKIVNERIEKRMNAVKGLYNDSKLNKVENYYNKY